MCKSSEQVNQFGIKMKSTNEMQTDLSQFNHLDLRSLPIPLYSRLSAFTTELLFNGRRLTISFITLSPFHRLRREHFLLSPLAFFFYNPTPFTHLFYTRISLLPQTSKHQEEETLQFKRAYTLFFLKNYFLFLPSFLAIPRKNEWGTYKPQMTS